MMECYPRRGDAVISSYPNLASPMDNWMGGVRWTTPVPEPLVFEIAEEEKGVMRPMFSTHFLLMSDPLVGALRQSGVDNIEVYTAVIREIETGRTYDDYKAVNILGPCRLWTWPRQRSSTLARAATSMCTSSIASPSTRPNAVGRCSSGSPKRRPRLLSTPL